MRLTQYLTEFQNIEDQEGSRVKKIKQNQAIDMVKSKCKKALNDYRQNRWIERYANHAPSIPYGFLDASKLPDRLSRNSFNYYTLIINDDPTWKGFPKRQVIGSYRIKSEPPYKSASYFIIFPFDGVKVGVCKSQDIWDSFSVLKTVGITSNRYNNFINKMLNQGQQGKPYDKSLPQFKKACKQTDEWFKSLGGVEYVKEVLPDLNRSLKTLKYYDGDFYKSVVDIYNPTNFKIGQPGAYKGSEMNEVWFDGPAIFVNGVEAEDFMLPII